MSLAWLPATLLLTASFAGAAVLTGAPKGMGAPIAAAFPVEWSAEQAFAAAASTGSPIIRPGGVSTMIVLDWDQPDLDRRLTAAGAWLLLDPKAFGGCLDRRSE